MKHHNSSLPGALANVDEQPVDCGQPNQLNRRKFFQIFGSGLAVAIVFQDLATFATGEGSPSNKIVPTSQVGAWIHIGEDGMVTVYTGKVEVGQNIRTSLSQVVSEELSVPFDHIKMIMGDTDLVPFDAGTYGSRSTPQMGGQLRKAAATARQSLVEMAAKTWNSKAETLTVEKGFVKDAGTAAAISYGELTKGQQLLISISDSAPVVSPAEWKVAGKTFPKVNGRSFITGRHEYVSDMKLPGMLYGKILRAPSYGATLTSVDTSAASAIPGVVVMHESDFFGVAAPDLKTADKAMESVNATWKENNQQPSRPMIFTYLPEHSDGVGSGRGSSKGDLPTAFAAAELTLKRSYHIDYIAHVPLEPRAALAEWVDGKLTVWTGTQRPFGVQEDLAETFKVPKEKVRVIMPDTGSGYGGKHSGEAALEAARLSLVAKKPVKIVWTRKEEFTWAYFRPAGVIEVHSGIKKDGSITAWKFDNYNSGPSGLDIQYRTGSQHVAFHAADSPLQQGSYRGLASTANVFARESQISDLARLVKVDQLQFRLNNLDDPRLKAVLQSAAKTFGWGTARKTNGHGYGIACGFEKGGYVGTCAEVLVSADKSVKVIRIVQAFECGAIINPWHLENQVMGSIVQGLGGALFEFIDFAAGKILNASLSAYRVPRFKDVPDIQVLLLDRKDLPSAGAGEAAIIGVAPAIRNAILDATGIALTTLPLIPTGTIA